MLAICASTIRGQGSDGLDADRCRRGFNSHDTDCARPSWRKKPIRLFVLPFHAYVIHSHKPGRSGTRLGAKLCAQLTSCRLVLNHDDSSSWSDPAPFFSFLEALTSLQDLDIILDRTFLFRSSEAEPGTVKILPELASLTLHTGHNCDVIGREFFKFLGPCPKLKRLSVDASLSYYESEQDWLRFLGPFGYQKYSSYSDLKKRVVRESQFPALEHLEFRLRDHYVSPENGIIGRSLTFDDAFAQLRHLKHLTLCGNRFRNILHWSDQFPRLHSLRLEDIDHLDSDLLDYVAGARQDGGSFEAVRMKNCSIVYGRKALSSSARQRLLWT